MFAVWENGQVGKENAFKVSQNTFFRAALVLSSPSVEQAIDVSPSPYCLVYGYITLDLFPRNNK